MIGSLEVTHEIILTIPSVIQISSINSNQLRFYLGKPQMNSIIVDLHLEKILFTNVTMLVWKVVKNFTLMAQFHPIYDVTFTQYMIFMKWDSTHSKSDYSKHQKTWNIRKTEKFQVEYRGSLYQKSTKNAQLKFKMEKKSKTQPIPNWPDLIATQWSPLPKVEFLLFFNLT